MTSANLGTWINKSAASRILGIASSRILKLYICSKGTIGVVYSVDKNVKGCTLIGRKRFLEDALSLRKNHTPDDYQVEQDKIAPQFFEVQFSGGDSHEVYLNGVESSCSCRDFQNQMEVGNGFSKFGFCKHLHAVLENQGFKSFSAYLNRSQEKVQVAA